MAEDSNLESIGVASALQRDFFAEGQTFLVALAGVMERALPANTEVVRSGGLLTRKVVTGLRLTLGDFRYEMDGADPRQIVCRRTHVVRGISLKTEAMDVPAWLEEVGAASETEMLRSRQVRGALGQFLGLS